MAKRKTQTDDEFAAELRLMLDEARMRASAAVTRVAKLEAAADGRLRLREVKVRAHSVRAYHVGAYSRFIFAAVKP